MQSIPFIPKYINPEDSPLVDAVQIRRVATVRSLLQCKNPQVISLLEHSAIIALIKACSRFDIEIIKTILECVSGSDLATKFLGYLIKRPYTTKFLDNTARMLVSDFGADMYRFIQRSYVKDIDINQVNNLGDTALHLAVQYRRSSHVKILCTHGANVNIRNRSGETALDMAVSSNCFRIAHLLIRQFNANPESIIAHRDEDKQSFLHICVKNRWNRMAELLVLLGADFDLGDRNHQTPYGIAHKNRYMRQVFALKNQHRIDTYWSKR
ncbi:ankyrin repeat-containing domain protein, partial [Jimgerdemannia flammicorona]